METQLAASDRRLNRSLEPAGAFTSALDELRRPRRIDCTARLSCSQSTSENSPHCSWPSLEQQHSVPRHPNLPEDSRSPKHFRGYRARLQSENTCRSEERRIGKESRS